MAGLPGSYATPLPYEVARFLSGALIPAFLLWRNFQTFKQRQHLIPVELMASSPWYYRVTVLGVWFALAFQFVLPAAGIVVGYSPRENSVATALLLGNVSAAGFWLQGPIVFFMEHQSAYHHRTPNNSLQSTCEDARA